MSKQNLQITEEQFYNLLQLFGEFTPRWYQEDCVKAIVKAINDYHAGKRGMKILSLNWPRRHGKDFLTSEMVFILAALIPGNYYYFFPTKAAAIENVFEGSENGVPWIDRIPRQFLDKDPNRSRFFIKLKNGSYIRFKGTDKDQITDLRGFKAHGIVMSEAAQHSDSFWPVVSPSLQETNGFLFMPSTFNGRNWYYRFHQECMEELKTDPEGETYYAETLDAVQAKVMTKEQLDKERKRLFKVYGSDTVFFQEYFNRVDVGAFGAIYHDNLIAAEEEGRIANIPFDNHYKVLTFLDIGRDGTAIWFVQLQGQKHVAIDYEEMINTSAESYVKKLAEKPYEYAEHFLPWDSLKQDAKDENTFRGIFRDLCKKYKICDNVTVVDRPATKNTVIYATQNVFRKMHFNKEKCEIGLSHLEQYHRSFDKIRKTYSKDPVHDEHSHAADAFGLWGMMFYALKPYEVNNTFDSYYDNSDELQTADLWKWEL